MTFLLDVNVLVALIDPAHVAHEDAHGWFGLEGAHDFATCPMTENGVIRVVGHTRYPNTPGSPAAVASILSAIRGLPGHTFWQDEISLLDAGRVGLDRLLTSAQVNDTYLLALAAAKGARLASFDRRLVTSAVPDGASVLFLIPPGNGVSPAAVR